MKGDGEKVGEGAKGVRERYLQINLCVEGLLIHFMFEIVEAKCQQ